MMLTMVHGNLFFASAHALVNTVNCVGVMGKGIARPTPTKPGAFVPWPSPAWGQPRRAGPELVQDTMTRVLQPFIIPVELCITV